MIQIAILITIFILYIIPSNIIIYNVFDKSAFMFLLAILAIFILVNFIVYVVYRMKYLKNNKNIELNKLMYNKATVKVDIVIGIVAIVLLIIQSIFSLGNIKVYVLVAFVLCYITVEYISSISKIKKGFFKNKRLNQTDDSEVLEQISVNEVGEIVEVIERYELEKEIDFCKTSKDNEENHGVKSDEEKMISNIKKDKFVRGKREIERAKDIVLIDENSDESVVSDELERYFGDIRECDDM